MSIKAYSSYTVIDVVDGMQWQDDATSHPTNPKEGWAYYNTVDKSSYIYDGEKWVVFAKDGSDTMSCYIESSAGTSFKIDDNSIATTTLIAYLYKGTEEIDENGDFSYEWRAKDKNGSETTIGTEKTIVVSINDIVNKSVYFIADDGNADDTSILYLARLGVMVLNKS